MESTWNGLLMSGIMQYAQLAPSNQVSKAQPKDLVSSKINPVMNQLKIIITIKVLCVGFSPFLLLRRYAALIKYLKPKKGPLVIYKNIFAWQFSWSLPTRFTFVEKSNFVLNLCILLKYSKGFLKLSSCDLILFYSYLG